MSTILCLLLCTLQVRDPDFRVGRISIEGNTATPDRIILAALRVFPGQRTDLEEIRKAEARLRALGVFQSNPWRGVGPTIRVEASNSDSTEYFDVLVRVRERGASEDR